jgi:hypothetical protein
MAAIKFQRVLALPGELEANTIYLVAGGDADQLEIHATNSAGTAARHTLTKAEVEALIAAGGAAGADKLTTPRDISITGDATWTVTFDGSEDVSAVLALANVGTAGEQSAVVTTDAKGRVVSSRDLLATDLPSEITSDTTGNAATATALETGRTINGVTFDGTQNIDISAEDTVTPRIAASEKGVANGVATLDVSGLVPASQLPSYVDDVVEVADFASLPVSGEQSKIYVTLDDNKIFRWSGSLYIQIPSGVGTADSAVKLATARSISVTGDATWTVNFDGSANVTAALTLANVGTAGEQGGIVTTDAKGRVTSSRALEAGDLPAEITSDTTGNAATADLALEANSVTLVAADW